MNNIKLFTINMDYDRLANFKPNEANASKALEEFLTHDPTTLDAPSFQAWLIKSITAAEEQRQKNSLPRRPKSYFIPPTHRQTLRRDLQIPPGGDPGVISFPISTEKAHEKYL